MNFNNKKHTAESGKSEQKKINSDGLKPGDYVRIIHNVTNEISFGQITYENNLWREIKQDTEFKVFSFHNYKFVREYEN